MMQIQISINGQIIELINVVNESSGLKPITGPDIAEYSVEAAFSSKSTVVEHNRDDGAVELARKVLDKITI